MFNEISIICFIFNSLTHMTCLNIYFEGHTTFHVWIFAMCLIFDWSRHNHHIEQSIATAGMELSFYHQYILHDSGLPYPHTWSFKREYSIPNVVSHPEIPLLTIQETLIWKSIMLQYHLTHMHYSHHCH